MNVNVRDVTRPAQQEQTPYPVSWAEAFGRELASLGAGARRDRLQALCLSGGGVRSAAFCLGVLQALAAAGQLSRFHYLSTVSGGGYIGAWLQTLIQRYGVADAQERLARGDAAEPGQAPIELRRLRGFTNWLMPNGGLLSLDGWTGLAIYLRNVLLNWLVFGPLFLLGALLAVSARTIFFLLQGQPSSGMELQPSDVGGWPAVVAALFLLVGLAGLVWGTIGSCRGLPSRRPQQDRRPDYWTQSFIERRIIAPSLVWAFCVPPALAPVWGSVLAGPWQARWALPLLFAVGSIAGYVAAGVTRPPGTPSYWHNLTPWCLASVAGALMLRTGLMLAWALPQAQAGEIMAIAGPAWLLLCYAVLSAVHAGLRGATGTPWSRHAVDTFSGLDIEWMARVTAMRLCIGLAWGGFAFCVLTLSHVLIHRDPTSIVLRPVGMLALIAGPAAAWLGKQSFSQVGALLSGRPGLVTWDLVLRAASLAFAAAVLAGSGVVLEETLGVLQDWFGADGQCSFGGCMLWAYLLPGFILAIILGGADSWIRTNRFSMHGVYRDRLVRAFVGSARPDEDDAISSEPLRRPDPFTGFDPGDNRPLHTLRAHERNWRLFPVINATLNLSGSRRFDWFDRKAAPFTLTPLHCGAAHLNAGDGRYVASADYAGSGPDGITLGTAMAVSGAAVSPNWGYHSSTLTAFVMTLFNARLGAWLPNPASPQLATGQAGAPGWRLLWDELLARTDDLRAYVYLSDGGHFDNLGLYEMLRRRCRLIAVVDATRDPDGTSSDLGALVSKARIDMGVQIRLLQGRPDAKTLGAGVNSGGVNGMSMGLIRYPGGGRGVLLLLKPTLVDDMPADVRAYHAQNPGFPNEATSEQWFTEAQFESYRALGAHQAGLVVERLRRRLARKQPELVTTD